MVENNTQEEQILTHFESGKEEGNFFFFVLVLLLPSKESYWKIFSFKLFLPSSSQSDCLLLNSGASFMLISTISTEPKPPSSVAMVDCESIPDPACISLNIAMT